MVIVYLTLFYVFVLQIAASYGSTVCIFEPVQQQDQKDTSLTVSRLHNLAMLCC